MQKVVVMGVGHLARFFIPLLKNYHITGVSRSFSTPTYSKLEYTSGQSLGMPVPKAPSAVIWNFPPHENFLKTLELAENYFSANTPYIFISSTSIYKNEHASEKSSLNPQSRLFPMEHYLSSLKRPVTILRPGGLFDSIRHPAIFFKNKKEVQGALSPVNLVHCQDLSRFLLFVLKNKLWQQTYNLVASTHPSKKEFYEKALKSKGLPLPKWSKIKSQIKVIENTKSINAGFNYLYDDLLFALNNL